jgi:hypothetical protein
MSVKELKSYAPSSDLDVDEFTAKAMFTQDIDINNADVNTLTTQVLNVNGLSNVEFVQAYQLSLNSVAPSIIEYKTSVVYTAPISTFTMAHVNGGIAVGNGAGIFKTNMDTAANLYAAYPLLNNQCVSCLCVNKTAFQWNFDLLDIVHVNYNESLATPNIPANSQKLMILRFTGTPSVPSYTIYL